MIKKTKLALGIAAALTLTGALVSSDAMAHSKKAKHHVVTESSSSYSQSTTSNSKVDALEAQLQAMQAEISSLRAQANRPAAEAGKVQELDQWMNSVKSAPAKEAPKDHLFSVRGGWMHFNDNRDSTQTLEGVNTAFGSDRDAHYYGGAVDFNMNNNLFGLMDHTSFGIEFGLEYAQLAQSKDNGLGGTGLVGRPAAQADVNQLRVSASPKIKFMHGSKLRPWLIPAGLDINIISPPSNAITVLNTGMQFGTGVDYELLKGIVIGADGRYHHSFDDVDGVDTDGFTLGGSVGFKW